MVPVKYMTNSTSRGTGNNTKVLGVAAVPKVSALEVFVALYWPRALIFPGQDYCQWPRQLSPTNEDPETVRRRKTWPMETTEETIQNLPVTEQPSWKT